MLLCEAKEKEAHRDAQKLTVGKLGGFWNSLVHVSSTWHFHVMRGGDDMDISVTWRMVVG